MVGAEFLGIIILIVYVGAVAVLFLFVVNDVQCNPSKKILVYWKKIYSYTIWFIRKYYNFFRIISCNWRLEI